MVFPTRLAAEKYGTLTNSAGRVQRVRPAVEPSWEAHSEGDVLTALGVALGLAGFDSHFDARQISSALAAQIPAFAACSWDEVGESGASLEENPA